MLKCSYDAAEAWFDVDDILACRTDGKDTYSDVDRNVCSERGERGERGERDERPPDDERGCAVAAAILDAKRLVCM